jgi:hypothetical protein
MNQIIRPDRESPITPESAVWLIYAGLVQGMRWRSHAVSAARPVPADSRVKQPGPSIR